MIVVVLNLAYYGLSLLRSLFKEEEKLEYPSPFRFEIPKVDGKAEIDEEEGLRFFPKVGFQRYDVVRDILKKKLHLGGINKVVDFGCSEIRFFRYVKNLEGVREYIAVDVDKELLERSKFKIAPFNADYLSNSRFFPFNAKVLLGSVADPDISLKNVNVVIAIELIEHLFPDVLEEFPYNIFGIVQPEIAVITTPNSDFNVLFTDLKGFRHYDHKFEWSREQFQDWAKNLVVRYPNYEVDFQGVGPGPEGTEELGCCSQLAVFFRKSLFIEESDQFKECYRVIKEVEYPYKTEEQIKLEKIAAKIGVFVWNIESEKYKKKNRLEIPLGVIHDFINEDIECDTDLLKNALRQALYDVEQLEDGSEVMIIPQSESSSDSVYSNHDNVYEAVDNQSPDEYWGERSPSPPNVFVPIEKFSTISQSESILRCKSFDQIVDKKSQNFRFSLNMEKYEDDKVAISSSMDTVGSHSKFDSGYPNSINMDMDLTPEQVDEITTEESSDSENEHINVPNVAHLLDNVENGDVANNNRDGEGNNMEDNQVGQPLEFEQMIQEGRNEVNFAADDSEEESHVDFISTTATIGSDPIASSNSLAGIPSLSHSSPSHDTHYLISEEFLFPEWLLNIDIIEEVLSHGDEPQEVFEIPSRVSMEVLVHGDTLGGGDPPN